ncbi:hypothetical protein L228DRAFT_259865 [Xylona heveae TC161]|uniref:Uncharacterized protein n=1 Tax=Xylona heveae (strain CBS 132557 / TC161) TaxID=1328760 RepID=A0A165IBS1_XYLHT|nr:hypothetical protein L228DRAFT_259865 [Xylona heveae TC161]KZF24681.1 hypothetical protein L228DRAFT_259865 [Xylona heveae TC161]
MASIASLGIHQPSALPQLIREHILPANPITEQFKWQTIENDGEEEELVTTETSVVWSQGGVVRKLFRFDIEGEKVSQAVMAWFPSNDPPVRQDEDEQAKENNCKGMKPPSKSFASASNAGRSTWASKSESSRRRPSLKERNKKYTKMSDEQKGGNPLSRALVVFLKTQAHVYFLSGTSHVINLPFEVGPVFPAPHGVVIQRKMRSVPAAQAPESQMPPPAPPNSFISAEAQPWGASSFQPSISFASLASSITRQSTPPPPPFEQMISPPKPQLDDSRVPKFFILSDPLSEMGLIVAGNGPQNGLHFDNPLDTGTTNLDPAEELIFISNQEEFSSLDIIAGEEPPLTLAVTLNTQTGFYTIWTMNYILPEPASRNERGRSISASNSRRRSRRSSYGPGAGTGASTPIAPSFGGSRESFGGAMRASSASFQHSALGPSNDDSRLDDEDELASQIDPDFEDGAAPAKQSRRVSSLLARTDVSTGHDRMPFSGLPSSHLSASTSHNGGSKRGESFGGYSSRGSFGVMTTGSRQSTSGQYLGIHRDSSTAPVDRLLEELNAGGTLEGFEDLGLYDMTEGLKKEIVMNKVTSFPIEQHGHPLQPNEQRASGRDIVVSTVCTPYLSEGNDVGCGCIVVYIVDKQSKKALMVGLQVQPLQQYRRNIRRKHKGSGLGYSLHLIEEKRGEGIIDAVRLSDGPMSRMLILSDTENGHGQLSLQAPWSTTMRIDLTEGLEPGDVDRFRLFVPPDEGRLHQNAPFVPSRSPLRGLGYVGPNGKVTLIDAEGQKHRIQVQMRPRNEHVARILDACFFVLPGLERGGEGLLVGYWEVRKWLRLRKEPAADEEWTSLIVLLFTMAVGFIEDKSIRQTPRTRARRGLHLRSDSGANVGLTSWEAMLKHENSSGGLSPEWMRNPAWSWVKDEIRTRMQEPDPRGGLKSPHPLPGSNVSASTKNSFLIDCAKLAREFLRSSAGKAAAGSQGYLPTAASRDKEVRRTALAMVLVGLHLIHEEQKLDLLTSGPLNTSAGGLTPVLAQIGGWLGWSGWSAQASSYYSVEDDDMELWAFDEATITLLDVPAPPFDPPSILSWAEQCFEPSNGTQFFSFAEISSSLPHVSPSRFGKASRRWTLREAERLTPYTCLVTSIYKRLCLKESSSADLLEYMVKHEDVTRFLRTLPEGLIAPLREAISWSQANPPTTWDETLLDLVGRDDIKMLLSREPRPTFVPTLSEPSQEAKHDVHSICVTCDESGPITVFDGSADVDRNAITRLIFHEDRRFAEAFRLVHQLKPAVARCSPEADWTETDLLEAQKELVSRVVIRTLALPPGRGLLYYSARVPLLTERITVPGFNLSCIMRPSNNTVTADKNTYSEEKICWAFFHSGVATGLTISREAKGIDTSWIVFNKPPELSNRHAGFLLALGLNGHLKSVAKWVAFKYLTPKHTMTSIGLLLGLAASYLGTMDTLVTRLLSVHVTRMLPPGAAELNLSPLTQTTGIMGIGLLYCNTQHRRMTEIMLSEIEHIELEDPSTPISGLRDEGYRLAAGFALGYINLGKGRDLRGLHDMHIVERLLSLAVGTKKVNIVHILDKSIAAAIVAIALIFMKTHDEALARRIDIPDTILQFDYVRPDIFLLRTLASNLIMWNKIEPSLEWIRNKLPKPYRARAQLNNATKPLSSQDMPFFNIVAGLCFSIGLRFAGSGSLPVRDLLLHYLDQFMRLCRQPAPSFDSRLARSTVRNCQDVVALSCAAVMAGTGDLLLFRRLRSLHGRIDGDTPYGSHLAGHIAIGVLFLGGGTFTFGTSNLAIASLLCAFYPLFPTAVLDNKSHLQAFRHFWVFAAEPRCLIIRDVDTHRPISLPVQVLLRDGSSRRLTAPCLVPELHDVHSLSTSSPEYWSVTMDFANNPSHLAAFKRNQTIYVRRRAAFDALYSSSIFDATLQTLNDSRFLQAVCADANNGQKQNAFDWIFQLPAFKNLDRAAAALVLPPSNSSSSLSAGADVGVSGAAANTTGTNATAASGGVAGAIGGAFTPLQPSLETTVVDDRLVFENASIASGNRDRLLNLRLLFTWADWMEKHNGGKELRWLGREVVERLRAAVWMAGNMAEENEEEQAEVEEY